MKRKTPNGVVQRYYRDVVLPHDSTDCLTWAYSKNPKGYGLLGGRPVHRIICELIHGSVPTPEHQAAHSCGNSSCVNWRHLSWKTPAENQADRLIHGTSNRGERNGGSKITEAEARSIKLDRATPTEILAGRYGVANSTINDIRRGNRWSWLPSPDEHAPNNLCGKRRSGEVNGSAKITENIVRQMRAERAAGTTLTDIAAKYGVGINTARRAIIGKNWSHVQ